MPEVTNAAAVNGTRLAERSRSNAQWCEPWLRDDGGNDVGSFTVPLRIARNLFSIQAEDTKVMKKNVRPPGT